MPAARSSLRVAARDAAHCQPDPYRGKAVLPASARLRRREDFTRTVRGGRKAARGSLVVHCLLPVTPAGTRSAPDRSWSDVDSVVDADPPRVGFVVPKAVGSAVVRNLVTRRLRHLMRPRLVELPAGTCVVVRALPSASEMSFDRLGADLDDALAWAAQSRSDPSWQRERRRDATGDARMRERTQ